MTLHEFIKFDGNYTMKWEEAAELNADLAKKSASDIPIENRQKVMSYLTVSLNMNSVDWHIQKDLDNLLFELQVLS